MLILPLYQFIENTSTFSFRHLSLSILSFSSVRSLWSKTRVVHFVFLSVRPSSSNPGDGSAGSMMWSWWSCTKSDCESETVGQIRQIRNIDENIFNILNSVRQNEEHHIPSILIKFSWFPRYLLRPQYFDLPVAEYLRRDFLHEIVKHVIRFQHKG